MVLMGHYCAILGLAYIIVNNIVALRWKPSSLTRARLVLCSSRTMIHRAWGYLCLVAYGYRPTCRPAAACNKMVSPWIQKNLCLETPCATGVASGGPIDIFIEAWEATRYGQNGTVQLAPSVCRRRLSTPERPCEQGQPTGSAGLQHSVLMPVEVFGSTGFYLVYSQDMKNLLVFTRDVVSGSGGMPPRPVKGWVAAISPPPAGGHAVLT
jgi:hypothetical protein